MGLQSNVEKIATAFPNDLSQRNTTSFVDNMKLPVHRWFRYSAGFSADWVQKTLQELGNPMEMRVLDPFAGSSTTLLAAQFVGAESVGIDSHPFIARVGQAKLHWTVDPSLLVLQGRALLHSSRRNGFVQNGDLPKLLPACYTPETLVDLLSLREALDRFDQGPAEVSALLWLAFVAIVRRVSFVGTAQWQYVLPNKRKAPPPTVEKAFLEQLNLMAGDMTWRQEHCEAPPAAQYKQADARARGSYPDAWATHVICSPPYANNYDYADATRLEQTVLGEVSGWSDLKQIRNQLMHSCSQHMVGFEPTSALSDPMLGPIIQELRPVYEALEVERQCHGGKKAYHSMILAYFQDLSLVWHALRSACAPDAQVCFVIGDSAPYGVHVPVERWLGELAVASGFSSWRFDKVRDRNLKWKNRKHRVPLHEGRLWVQG